MGKLPKIVEYENYRAFLRDYYVQKKALNPRFSFRVFARTAGFRSPNFLKLVMDGKRNLSVDGVKKLITTLGFNKDEKGYFKNLVLLNQAISPEDKVRYARQLSRSKFYQNLHPLTEVQIRLLTSWYYAAIRELTLLPEFREDPQWIATRLIPAIEPTDAIRALIELQMLGLLVRCPDGRLQPSNSIVATGDEVQALFVAEHHRTMMQKASFSIDNIEREFREISAVTLALSPENAQRIKTLIQRFRKDLLSISMGENSATSVYQACFQFFPLTEGFRPLADDKKEAA